jgi:hypothetical protein
VEALRSALIRQLAVADHDIAIGQLDLAGADGLDLPALQHHAGLEAFFDVIVEPRAAVFCDGHGWVCGRGALNTIGALYEARQKVRPAVVLAA